MSLVDILQNANNNERHVLLHALSSIPVSTLNPMVAEAYDFQVNFFSKW